MLSIRLYAELLCNIGQVNISATLPSKQNDSTRVELSPNRKILTLTHDGQTESIQLPREVASPAAWTTLVPKSPHLSFRLQISETTESAWSERGTNVTAPWIARSLTDGTEIACRVCKTIILARSGMIWKDLPSGDWAESMEFWHCHQPINAVLNNTNAHQDIFSTKRLKARSGIGLLDTCHMVLAEHDCLNIKDGEERKILCLQCLKTIGSRETNLGGIRFDKWAIAIRHAFHADWEQYPAQVFLTAKLLERTERQGVRKFVVCNGDPQGVDEALVLWVFNPDLRYSTSTSADGPRHAIKILYKVTASPKEILAQHTTTVEELELPNSMISEFRKNIEASTMVLPVSTRKLQGWQVGLLDLFDSIV